MASVVSVASIARCLRKWFPSLNGKRKRRLKGKAQGMVLLPTIHLLKGRAFVEVSRPYRGNGRSK